MQLSLLTSEKLMTRTTDFPHTHILRLAVAVLLGTPLAASAVDEAPRAHAEAAFWSAFNRCDLEQVRAHLASDLEFYHDQDGAIVGAEQVLNTISDNLCAGPKPLLRRELVAGSEEPHRIPGFGTLVVGEHVFYALSADGSEHISGQVKFSHLWRDGEQSAKLSRVLSYAHGRPSAQSAAVRSTVVELQAYVGSYQSQNSGAIQIAIADGQLLVTSGGFQTQLLRVSDHQFRSVDAPLAFGFNHDDLGVVSGFDVLENGSQVDAASRD